MASMKNIKNRIKSVENTMQITKAMELVAASKLRRAKITAEKTKPYMNALSNAIYEIGKTARGEQSIFFGKKEEKRLLFVIIAGDRGLAGGFNHNLFKLAMQSMPENIEVSVFPIGKKVSEFFKKQNVTLLKNSYEIAANVHIGDCLDMGKRITEGYASGEYDAVTVFYTGFNSMLTQSAVCEKILPIKKREKNNEKGVLRLYEPDEESVLKSIVPAYVSGMLFGAVSESLASEYAARRTAMNSANKNAQDMIDELTVKYNRARQAAITQEITEIAIGSGEV